MREDAQILLSEMGESSCLALTIVQAGKPECTLGEAVDLTLAGIALGYITYDWESRANPENLFVADRDAFLNMVTGESGWKSTRETAGYRAAPGEIAIESWEWREELRGTVALHTHFRMHDWDSWRGSKAVTHGALVGYRIFRKAA